jgi:hypothetical protein
MDPDPVPSVTAEATDPILLAIGDITVSKYWIVTLDSQAPIAGSTWDVVDLTRVVKKHPTWTIVLAVILFPIGLLFLLVKEDKTYGVLEVRVTADKFFRATQVPVTSPDEVHRIRQDVNRAQSLAIAA